MRLSELFDGPREGQNIAMSAAVDIRGLSADSRQVEPGFVFAALPGARTDGRRFIDQAVGRGAVAVLAEPNTPVPAGTVLLVDPNPRRRLALMAAIFYGAQPRHIAAVTGTSGKTSTVDFTRQLWTQLGRCAASLGTLGLVTPERTVHGALTTPDPVALHTQLAELAKAGVDRLAMEASSHGLDQFPLRWSRFWTSSSTSRRISSSELLTLAVCRRENSTISTASQTIWFWQTAWSQNV